MQCLKYDKTEFDVSSEGSSSGGDLSRLSFMHIYKYLSRFFLILAFMEDLRSTLFSLS